MALKIYGTPVSRANRTIWMCEELGLDYEIVPVDNREAHAHPELLKISPNGRVPVIDDEGTVVSQSLAINLYLARKHGGDLAPADFSEETKISEWSFWAAADLEPHAFTYLLHAFMLPEDQRQPERAEDAKGRFPRMLKVLETALEQDEYLVGGRFTVADLNVGSVVNWLRYSRYDFSDFPAVQAWLQRCNSRPAARRMALSMRN